MAAAPEHKISGEYQPAEIFLRLLRISGRHWPVFIGVVASAAVFGATDAGFAYLVKTLTEIVQAGTELTEQQQLIRRWLPLAVLLLFIARGISNFLSRYGMGWIARMAVMQLRGKIFRHYLDLPTAFFDQNASGMLLSKMTYDVGQIAESASNVIIILIKDTLTIVLLVVYMVYLSPQLAWFVFLVAPVVVLLVKFLGGLFRKHNLKIQDSVGNITRIAAESLQANRIIKIFGARDFEDQRFSVANDRNRRLEMRLLTTQAAGDGVTVFVSAFGIAGVIYLISVIDIDVSSVAAFMTAMVLLMAPLKRLTNVNATVQRGVAAGASIFRIIDMPGEVDTGTFDPEHIEGRVEFRDVSFAYAAEKGQVLHNINLIVEPGEKIAIVGRSGSGKSTLVSLLPRFYDPQSGSILIDGRPSTDYLLSGLRRHVALVSQEVTLFNDTVEANIAYGGLADVSADELRKAADAAHVSEFVDALPEQFATIVGDRGVMLSGGQRQRISIARALLKNAPILVLDEATSALDTQSERHIQSALDKLMENRTTFVIAHRLSTIENADRIVVMENGRIIEIGKHAELLAAEGAYAALHRLQFRDADGSPA